MRRDMDVKRVVRYDGEMNWVGKYGWDWDTVERYMVGYENVM